MISKAGEGKWVEAQWRPEKGQSVTSTVAAVIGMTEGLYTVVSVYASCKRCSYTI